MARKLKVYQTSLGFYDLVIATPSMKAALEAWGAASNLFHQGFASEVADKATIDAALDKPGIVLRRPVGSNKPFSESVELPDDLTPEPSTRKKAPQAQKPKASKDNAAARRAAAAYEKRQEKEDAKRKRDEEAEAKARERREAAIARAQSKLDEAEREHDDAMADLKTERSAIEKRIEAEGDRWTAQREKLEAAFKRAKSR